MGLGITKRTKPKENHATIHGTRELAAILLEAVRLVEVAVAEGAITGEVEDELSEETKRHLFTAECNGCPRKLSPYFWTALT